MKIYDRVKNYLEKEPRARERTYQARAMINLLLEDYPEFKDIPKQNIIDFCQDFESFTRQWRKVTEENVYLRGQDYADKQILEENKMLELGYSPNYNQDTKKLATLY